jgi:hypothetical protein
MGNMHAEEFASMKGKNKDMGLLAHLQGNHYPPVPASMLGPSKHPHLQLLKHTTYMRG